MGKKVLVKKNPNISGPPRTPIFEFVKRLSFVKRFPPRGEGASLKAVRSSWFSKMLGIRTGAVRLESSAGSSLSTMRILYSVSPAGDTLFGSARMTNEYIRADGQAAATPKVFFSVCMQ